MNGKHITLIFLLALIIRLVYVWGIDAPPVKDAAEYCEYAQSMIDGKGFQARGFKAFRMPLYPVLIASFNANPKMVRFYQAIIGALSCVLGYLIALKLFGERTALICGLMFCFYKAFIVYTSVLLTETLFMFLALFSVLLFLHKHWFCGIALGIMLLTRLQGAGLVLALIIAGVHRWQR